MLDHLADHARRILLASEAAACGIVAAVINVDSAACSQTEPVDGGTHAIIAAFVFNMMIHAMWAHHIATRARRGWTTWAISLAASIWASRLARPGADDAFYHHIQCLYIPWTIKTLEHLEMIGW